MSVRISYLVILMLLVVGCASLGVKADHVKISGVVVDELTGNPISQVNVHLYVFKQGSIFTMGSFVFQNELMTSAEGAFKFTVKKGGSFQIRTKGSGSLLGGGLMAIRNVLEDKTGLVVEHNSSRS